MSISVMVQLMVLMLIYLFDNNVIRCRWHRWPWWYLREAVELDGVPGFVRPTAQVANHDSNVNA